MLETAYDSVTVKEKDILTEESLRILLDEYCKDTKETLKMTKLGDSFKISFPRYPFDIINKIETKFGKHSGYKLIDRELIISMDN